MKKNVQASVPTSKSRDSLRVTHTGGSNRQDSSLRVTHKGGSNRQDSSLRVTHKGGSNRQDSNLRATHKGVKAQLSVLTAVALMVLIVSASSSSVDESLSDILEAMTHHPFLSTHTLTMGKIVGILKAGPEGVNKFADEWQTIKAHSCGMLMSINGLQREYAMLTTENIQLKNQKKLNEKRSSPTSRAVVDELKTHAGFEIGDFVRANKGSGKFIYNGTFDNGNVGKVVGVTTKKGIIKFTIHFVRGSNVIEKNVGGNLWGKLDKILETESDVKDFLGRYNVTEMSKVQEGIQTLLTFENKLSGLNSVYSTMELHRYDKDRLVRQYKEIMTAHETGAKELETTLKEGPTTWQIGEIQKIRQNISEMQQKIEELKKAGTNEARRRLLPMDRLLAEIRRAAQA